MSATRYPAAQIALHWAVVFLVAFQFFTAGGMSAYFYDDANPGTAWVHGILGLSLLALMTARLALRASADIPPPPETEPRPLQIVSRGVHYAFYALLIAMPVAGLAAVLTGSEVIATAHAFASKALLALIAAHVAGAAWHLFKRDGVVSRIMPGAR